MSVDHGCSSDPFEGQLGLRIDGAGFELGSGHLPVPSILPEGPLWQVAFSSSAFLFVVGLRLKIRASHLQVTCNTGNFGRKGDQREQQLVFRNDEFVQHGVDHIMVELRTAAWRRSWVLTGIEVDALRKIMQHVVVGYHSVS